MVAWTDEIMRLRGISERLTALFVLLGKPCQMWTPASCHPVMESNHGKHCGPFLSTTGNMSEVGPTLLFIPALVVSSRMLHSTVHMSDRPSDRTLQLAVATTAGYVGTMLAQELQHVYTCQPVRKEGKCASARVMFECFKLPWLSYGWVALNSVIGHANVVGAWCSHGSAGAVLVAPVIPCHTLGLHLGVQACHG
jgi:hypothetical protein